MEKEHYRLDQDRQSWANLSPASAERAPLRRRLFMAAAAMAGNDVNLQLQVLIEQAKNWMGMALPPFKKTCVKGKYYPGHGNTGGIGKTMA
ncbi:hypothetical protein [Synechocystis salina]|uniref:hypothetical protein n=1 Tax=Synechocystis salina TaxID=945780 RepID=UPI001D14119A|nr:hypothetical protein [Synechocystis salina]